MPAMVCWNCGASLAEVSRPIRRSANCLSCYAELHCCRLCRHYDEDLPGRCDDERADPPSNKEGANFCEFFTPKPGAYDRDAARGGDAARDRLEALFGGGGEEAVEENADPDAAPPARDPDRARFDALFGNGDDHRQD